MRPLDKVEKYLKRYIKDVKESERSRYFTLNKCTIRVSDHYAVNSPCYLSIILPTNPTENYLITNPTTAKFAIVSYNELKGIIKSLCIIPDVTVNGDIIINNTKLDIATKNAADYKSRLSACKVELNNTKQKYNACKVELNNIKQKYEKALKNTNQTNGIQQRNKQLTQENDSLRKQLKEAKGGKNKSIYGVNENNLPLSVRQAIHELVDKYL